MSCTDTHEGYAGHPAPSHLEVIRDRPGTPQLEFSLNTANTDSLDIHVQFMVDQDSCYQKVARRVTLSLSSLLFVLICCPSSLYIIISAYLLVLTPSESRSFLLCFSANMKFRDGMWLSAEGKRPEYAEEVYSITEKDNGKHLELLCPTRKIRERGDTLNLPTLTMVIRPNSNQAWLTEPGHTSTV